MLEEILAEFAAIVLESANLDLLLIDDVLARPKTKLAISQLSAWLLSVPNLTDESIEDHDKIWE